MKKKFIRYFLLLFLISFNSGWGQSQEARRLITARSNERQLQNLQQNFHLRAIQDKQAAYSYASAQNIPTVIEKPNGGISVLQRVTKRGVLIYYTTVNEGAAVTTRTTSLYDNGSLGLNLEGQGMVMSVWDGGSVRGTHELLKGMVDQLDNDPMELNSHATHVSGTLIGAAGVKEGAQGMAFKATLNAFDFNDDIAEITNEASNGLLLSNHSYGYDPSDLPDSYFGRYDPKAQAIDQIAFNAPYYLMVVAAGNTRNSDENHNENDNGYDLLTDMAVAKNNLTVAAVHQVTDYSGPQSVVMTDFSNWGPPDDGRVKPDISAKGLNVLSSTADSDDSYAYYSGTSMAAPNVSGSLLLLQQLSHNLNGTYLKSATLKGLAIHSALEAGLADGPDYQFGWGLLNMEDAAKLILDKGFMSNYEEQTLNEGETYNKEVNAVGEDQALKVTLVWTDPAGAIQPDDQEDDSTKRLINDLDVRVEDQDGNVTYPWRLDGSNYMADAEKGDNSVDNVEKIELPNAVGKYTINVKHKGHLENNSQDYSLIVSGISNSEFTFTPDNIAKTFCSSEEAQFNFNFLETEDYDEPTEFSTTDLPSGLIASFSPISTEKKFTLTLSGLGSVEPGAYTFTVKGEGGTSVIEKELKLKILDATVPETITLSNPEQAAKAVSIYPTLTWQQDPTAESYIVEVAEDQNFNSLVLTRETENLKLKIPGLNPNTTYYWRVQGKNNCSTGSYTNRIFTTENLYCGDPIIAADTPIKITPFTKNNQVSTLTISEGKNTNIGDLNVAVKLTHSNLGDLKIFLVSPSGTEVLLLNNSCGNRENMDVIFDDAAVNFACDEDQSTTLSGTIIPQEALNKFIGEDSAGEWTLRVEDEAVRDGGSIDRFELHICGITELSVKNTVTQQFSIYPNPTAREVNIQLRKNINEALVTIYDLNGRTVFSKRKTTNSRMSFNTNTLQAGVYFVEVLINSNRTTKKLIVE